MIPALLIVLPLFWFLLGFKLAVAHALLGFAGAVVMLEVLLFCTKNCRLCAPTFPAKT